MTRSRDDRPELSTTHRLRLFGLHAGTCHICGQPIDGVRERWEIEHVIPRALIGREADTDANMRPAHARCHKGKTVRDVDDIARAKRRHAKHFGAWRPDRPFPGSRASDLKRCMIGTVLRRPRAPSRTPNGRPPL